MATRILADDRKWRPPQTPPARKDNRLKLHQCKSASIQHLHV